MKLGIKVNVIVMPYYPCFLDKIKKQHNMKTGDRYAPPSIAVKEDFKGFNPNENILLVDTMNILPARHEVGDI